MISLPTKSKEKGWKSIAGVKEEISLRYRTQCFIRLMGIMLLLSIFFFQLNPLSCWGEDAPRYFSHKLNEASFHSYKPTDHSFQAYITCSCICHTSFTTLNHPILSFWLPIEAVLPLPDSLLKDHLPQHIFRPPKV